MVKIENCFSFQKSSFLWACQTTTGWPHPTKHGKSWKNSNHRVSCFPALKFFDKMMRRLINRQNLKSVLCPEMFLVARVNLFGKY